MPVTINGIAIDPATATHISTHPGGDANFEPMDNFRRFDEHLYKTVEGFFFVLRPLDPEEAEAWILAHGDEPLARKIFPDDEDAAEPAAPIDAGGASRVASLSPRSGDTQ